MAVTKCDVNNASAVEELSEKLSTEISEAIDIASLIGEGPNSIIQLKTEVHKGKGDQVTFRLGMQLTGDGVSEGTTLEGKEKSDSLFLNELSCSFQVKNDGEIDAIREEAKDAFVGWYADRLSLSTFLHFCGYTGNKLTSLGSDIEIKNVHYAFNNVVAPSASNHIRANGKASEDELDDKDTFTLSLIDIAVEKAKLSNPKVRPVRINGDDVYVMYLHPTQVTSLRTNTENNGKWLDFQNAFDMGSRSNYPIFQGSLGMYNGVILRETEYIMPGFTATKGELPNVRRAVLLGAQAGLIAFGKGVSAEKYKIVEELFVLKRELGVLATTSLGIKKTRYNDKDFGVIVVSTFAKPLYNKD